MKGSNRFWLGFWILILTGLIVHGIIPNWDNEDNRSVILWLFMFYLFLCILFFPHRPSRMAAKNEEITPYHILNIWYWTGKLFKYIIKIYEFINKIADKYLTTKK